ncbi:TldD/PmbA family protein [Candidatus Bathyarchaeota archaeon]|nr:TldD/PmbA family protein [Candidatus Bathyarchaeota archaeon]MBS7617719.1 TldD/PmbA family protein [Candidatus Bathyarchaeota archaeon]
MYWLKDLLEEVVQKGLSEGASFCEVRYFEERSSSIGVENGIARALSSGILRGVGVRVIVGGHWGFASTNIPTRQSVEKALEDAMGGARSIMAYTGEEAKIVEVKPSVDTVVHDVKINPEDVSPEEKVKRVLELEKDARTFSDRVKDTFISYRDVVTRVIVCNSFGTFLEEVTPRTVMYCRVIAKEGENMQESFEALGNVAGYELIDGVNVEDFSLKAAKRAVRLLTAHPPPRGTYPVVVDPRVGGLFVHEAIGHNSEGDLVFSGQSIISDKMHQKIASRFVTIIDDPTKRSYGHFTYDHEGIKAKPHVLIKDGVLVGFLHSLESAAKLSGEPEGSARAQSHHYPPIVRMSNTYLAPGDMTLEEILEGIDCGVYLSGSQYGYVESQKGQFTCKVEEAWLIEKGELTEHLRDVAISGLTLEALKNIVAVGKDLRMEMPGMCGKSGQGMYVDAGAPHFRIDGIVVGGRR